MISFQTTFPAGDPEPHPTTSELPDKPIQLTTVEDSGLLSQTASAPCSLSPIQDVRSRRSSSIKPSDTESTSIIINIDESDAPQAPGAAQALQQILLRPQSDISYDEDTSSTSGYRESYSTHQIISLEETIMSREGPAPPLASPDLPSTSSTTTNCGGAGFDGSSPDCSIDASAADQKTVILTQQSSQGTSSQHSLLPQHDEDTLI